MALNDQATLVIGAGNFYMNPTTGDSAPTDLKAVPSPWVNIGHTSIEDILGFDTEGGDQTILKTLQNKSLRTRREAITDTLSLTVQQFDKGSLKLYFGSNSSDGDFISGAAGEKWLRVKSDPKPTVCAFLAVFIDGENIFAIHIPKCEIMRGDSPSFDDTENLAGLPLKITPLQFEDNDWTMEVTPLSAA